jgi:hypothetical protein
VRLAVAQAEDRVHVEAGVHAGDDGQVRGGRERQRAAELLGVGGVALQVFVGRAHETNLPLEIDVPGLAFTRILFCPSNN